MINLFNVKAKQRENAENTNGNMTVKKQTAGELRLNKDVLELKLPKSCNISFPNGKNDLMNFEVTIRPDEGYYQGGTFHFSSQVPSVYPHEPPKVKCKTKVYHPNIDLEGNVCLNILREDWKPVLNINTVIYGLFHLFTQPNYEDPLNQDAAAVLRDNPKMLEELYLGVTWGKLSSLSAHHDLGCRGLLSSNVYQFPEEHYPLPVLS